MVLAELVQANPRASIIVISGFVSLFISLINYFVIDKEKVRKSKEKQKELQKQMKEHKNDSEKMMELNKELVSHAKENLKHSFKPMLITIVPILVIFGWLKGIYSETSIGGTSFLFPVWVWYYIGAAIIFSIIFRKLFKLP